MDENCLAYGIEIPDSDWEKTLFLCQTIGGENGAVYKGSIAAQTGGGVGLHYAASKAGQLGLTYYYAKNLVKENITVNAIAPALIDTDMSQHLDVNPSSCG